MVMAYASPIVVYETISTDSVKERGDLHLLNGHQSEELDRTARDHWPGAYCAQCRCCKNG